MQAFHGAIRVVEGDLNFTVFPLRKDDEPGGMEFEFEMISGAWGKWIGNDFLGGN